MFVADKAPGEPPPRDPNEWTAGLIRILSVRHIQQKSLCKTVNQQATD